MHRGLSQLAVVVAMCLPRAAASLENPEEQPWSADMLPSLGTAGIPAAALIGVGVAAAAALAGGGGGGGGSSGGAEPAPGGTLPPASNAPIPPSAPQEISAPARTLNYTSAADFRSTEYGAQRGLALVGADALYYNGHYRWYLGEVSDPAAGTGGGVKIAVADTGINASEASTGGAIAIDTAASYDYIGLRAGSAADDYGHGTHVAGIIAAPRNGSGMHGLAHNASLINFKVGDSRGNILATDAQRADMLGRAMNAGAYIVNNSWASATSITAVTAADVQAMMPRMVSAARAYVAGGGVVVFAAGNEAAVQPSLEAGLPHWVSGIEPGWLAVVALDLNGAIASYSNRCGVAAAWCLAAPGGTPDVGIYSMHLNGGYASLYGTSMAVPHAAAAIGALKSMFPNLTYLQLRERLLFTANRGGSYADGSTYGQGAMDLAAASSPVGGIALPTGSSATGATASVTESAIVFPAGTLQALGMQRAVLVVDNYQRAPFWIPAQAFFREARPRMLERQWTSLRSPLRGALREKGMLAMTRLHGVHDVVSIEHARQRFGFSSGPGGEAALASHLRLAWRPQLAAPGGDSVGLGYAADIGRTRIGLLGTLPSGAQTTTRSLEASPLGTRRALGFVAQQQAGRTAYGIALAAADDFERPLGIAASGAFGAQDRPALSSGVFVEHEAGRAAVLRASYEVTRYRPEGRASVASPAYALSSVSLGAHTALAERTSAALTFKRDWSGSEAARLYVPLTIAESGDIGRVAYALPYQDLMGRSALSLQLEHAPARGVALRASLTRERQGFGLEATGLAAILEVEL